jgi:cell wall-associated NlpC family hydrolase
MTRARPDRPHAKAARARWPVALAIACAALALPACGVTGSGHKDASSHRVSRVATLRLQQRFSKPQSQDPQYGIHHIYKMTGAEQQSIPAPGAPVSASAGKAPKLPPASAGSNGSFVAPHGASGAGGAGKVARLSRQMASGSAVLLGGIALPPPNAPGPIQAAIRAGNSLVGQPYVWGGGHSSWYSKGYDCSGAVSFTLGAAGFLEAPLDSTHLESWGRPGPGRWLTVYANPGHAFAVIDGVRWDTVGDARGSGPRWHSSLEIPAGFVARHPPGY